MENVLNYQRVLDTRKKSHFFYNSLVPLLVLIVQSLLINGAQIPI